ncbi:CGNR zinc finger domain-containing protein [Prauserella muralis]|uniref:Uncharacterized protein n=1 Tax=Prauserella muralis TaxID=588067 RepID=A0A2V4B9Z5_9PSEU|nr:CGNR zinc finger domain-containing protein [Prauserella muralis]PXY31946.1 hypothetical protein BAY60_06370 [Prauserella muralis]TWE13628.1 putative RNA-binding Zn ribbon-like protein [Prauserella muralis]
MADSGWVFDSGRACLDLVNTRRDRHAGGRELLTGPAALTEWLSLAGFTGRADAAHLAMALDLREAIDRVTRSVSAGHRPAREDVRVLNEAARAAAPPALRLGADGTPHRAVAPSADPVAAALGALAVDAIDLVTSPVTVRICAADDCGLRLADASPQRNRQWCSMARCGNRAKARAHYARRKLRDADPSGGGAGQ